MYGVQKATAQPESSYVPASALIRQFDEHGHTRDTQLTNTGHFAWVAPSHRSIRQTDPNGFRFPTKRRMYVRGPGLKPIRDLLLISLDLSNFRLTT
jgi:hypothetical protein